MAVSEATSMDLDALGRRSGQAMARRHVEEPGSRLCADIDERVNAFLTRPLEGVWPYLWLDATYLKVREGGRIVSRAVIIAVAVNDDGKREVLGVATGPSEAETFWTDFLRSLADRGLRVKLVVADDHKGLRAAAAGCSTPRTSAAAFTGCATRSPMRRRSSAWPWRPC